MPPSVIEIVEWPHPKIHIAVDKTFLDNVKCARDPPIEVCFQSHFIIDFAQPTPCRDLDLGRRQPSYT